MENRKWKMENGKWKMENGKWKMENGKWKMENGKWKMENGKWKMENGKWKMENGKWKMENGKWKMENGKWKMENDKQVLAGRTAIITGASHGIGFEIALAYLKHGASLCICARDAKGLETAASVLRPYVVTGQRLIIETGDVSNEQDVARIVGAAAGAFSDRIDVLVNNAGVYGPIGLAEDLSWAEWMRTIEINLFGSVLMARAVIPFMKRARSGKIIQLSGGGATKPMARFTAYSASKAAVVRFAESLADEVQADGIDVNAVAPGALNTRFLDELLAAGPDKVGAAIYKRSLEQKESGGAPFER